MGGKLPPVTLAARTVAYGESRGLSPRTTVPERVELGSANVGDTLVRASQPTVAVASLGAARYHRTTVFPRSGAPNRPGVSAQLPRFEDLEPLGRGGVGEVTLAKDHDIDRTVAVKRLLEPDDPMLVSRFVDEVRVVGQLEHPNIVPVHDVGVDADGHYYFVMKHLEGETLEAIIAALRAGDRQAHARFSFAARAQLVISVLNALAYAHQRGFLHRDLKPGNIMVGPYGEVTVVDWGLAKRIHGGRRAEVADGCSVDATQLEHRSPVGGLASSDPADGAIMGTPAYMAPEQARGAHSACDERTDLYALGVVLYELMHLEHPLEAHLARPLPLLLEAVQTAEPLLHDAKARPGQLVVPAEIDWLLHRALQKDPSRRFQTAEAMGLALRRVLEGDFPVQCHRTFGKRVLHAGAGFIDRFPRLFIVGLTLTGAVALGSLVNLFIGG